MHLQQPMRIAHVQRGGRVHSRAYARQQCEAKRRAKRADKGLLAGIVARLNTIACIKPSLLGSLGLLQVAVARVRERQGRDRGQIQHDDEVH